ncbi:hypothetical protein HPB49_021798 [Dermacentor silvarum]|uniref:Uncharacterized protein n=1 Tax=Dermacentor silvarum TaxID=543639 RepID=A0ACB8CTC4_DERSI|nr:uncharacterized protein LOC119454099 [Dermacentor silvarum]KAH7950277.1 hypothetical protein HPB49_021798 [Dermacentor silvarum]
MVSLRANLGVSSLVEQLKALKEVWAIRELDLTNCILVEPDELPLHIGKCTGLQSLRCVACPIRPSDLLGLMLERLPFLVEVEFSLVSETDVASEVRHMHQIESQLHGALALNLRRMYAEVSGYHNFKLLSTILRYCPKLEELRVHFVRGTFSNALLECNVILKQRVHLETFTFSSEVPASIQRVPSAPLEFTSCAAVCANVSYQRSSNSWSCVRLRDLAVGCTDPLVLPLQLVVAAVHNTEGTTEEFIRVASIGHVWTNVCQLCLVLFPAEPSSGVYPAAGASYRDSLRDFFTIALKHIVELNISSFHFGPDLDLTELLQDGSLKYLQSFSAPPCGLRRPPALRRLAQNCPDFKELDVRIDRRGSFVRCAVCEGEFFLNPEDMVEMNNAAPVFHNGLARLTLNDVHGRICLWFVEACPAVTVRLSDCPSPLHPDYPSLGHVLAVNSSLRCLVLRHGALPFGDTYLLANLSRIAGLQYLCLLSEASVLDNVAAMSVLALSASLKPHIKCIHVHYRNSAGGTEKRITWMQRAGAASGGVLVRDGPCFLCCSTATFIGLAKPLNRDFKPIL